VNIVVIEDNPGIRQGLQDLLELNGHRVITAGDGAAGLALVNRQVDLIICDIGLPGINGYEVIARLQQDEASSSIPFIFLTAREDREDHRRAMVLGADDYITKPFTEQEILDAIAARVRRQQPLRTRLSSLMAQQQQQATARWSHELLTPLNCILGGLLLIESEIGTSSKEEIKEALGFIRCGAERQLALAHKLIMYHDLEQRRAAMLAGDTACVPRHEMELVPIVERAARKKAADLAHGADLELDLEPVTLWFCPQLVAALVTELVENACRFSAADQPIAIRGRRHKATYTVQVVDRGIGLEPSQIERIAPFVQFDRRQHEQQGLGLGLAIVRNIVALTGGRLSIAGNPDGVGLRVDLSLPIAAP
jgi:two-component system, sensor histidine kinase and response regulator